MRPSSPIFAIAVAAVTMLFGGTARPTTAASSGPLLVVVAHPDDEAISFAGVIEAAVSAGRTVDVAVVTNGDAPSAGTDGGWCGAASGTGSTTAHYGITRDRETLAGMSLLGLGRTSSLATTRIVFLGYPDSALATIANASSPWSGDATGLHHTYADDGDGSNSTCNGDLHYLATGSHAQFTAADLAADIDRVIAWARPADVYTHTGIDGHPDHATVNALVRDAIARAGTPTQLHTSLQHPQGTGSCMYLSASMWPNPADPSGRAPSSRFTPGTDFTAPPTPPCSTTPTGSSWGADGPPDEIVPVPADMRTTDLATNRKWQVISQYVSQLSCVPRSDGTYPASCGYMYAFVKADEFFWTQQVGGAPTSTAPPTVTGAAVQGQALTTDDGSWSGSPTAYAYAWRRCAADGGTCAAIPGAAARSYTLTSADVGSTIRSAVTATNAAGSTTAVSAATATVTAPGSDSSFGQSIAGTAWDGGGAGWLDMSGPYTVDAAVTVVRLNAYVSGGAAQSRVRGVVYRDSGGRPGALVAVTSEVTTPAGAAAGWVALPLSTPVTIAAGSYWLGYWYADGSGRRAYVDVPGTERYAPAAYSATGAPPSSFPTGGGSSSSSYSLTATYTGAAPTPPENLSPPAISGAPLVGATLTATTGTWSGGPTSYAYDWRRCDSSGSACAPIGAAASSYTVGSADVGSRLRVAVRATNSTGTAEAVSDATDVITAAPPPPSGGTFGRSAVGTLVDGGAAGYLDVSGPYSVTVTGTLTHLDAYVAGGASPSRMRGVVYRDSGGGPGALVAVTPELTVAAGDAARWVELPFSTVPLGAGSYWLGYWYADGNGRRYYVDAAGAERYAPAAYSATAAPPSTFPAASTSSSSYSLVATYTVP